MQDHSHNVEVQIAVEIQMTGRNSDNAAEQRHHRRSHPELREKLRQAEPDLAIEVKIDNPLHLARLESRFHRGRRGVDLLRHHHRANSALSALERSRNKSVLENI